MSNNNFSIPIIEFWFIPIDIFMMILNILSLILCLIYLLILIFDKTCHTIPMLLVGNSCICSLVFGIYMFGSAIFTLNNDLKQLNDPSILCVFRGYVSYVVCSLLNYSFLIQAIYRYIIIIYPHRLLFQTIRFQLLIIIIIYILCFIHPFVYTFNNEIIYDVDNQVCQIKLQFSFTIIYMVISVYIFPILLIMFIYYQLVCYVRRMNKNIIIANTINRAKNELKMVRRTVILVTVVTIVCLPYRYCSEIIRSC